jgi:hypothetical protein
MTSSFGITPQRQVRDQLLQPEQPQALPKPAEPAGIPQQVGGQLMYSASYQPDTKTQQTIKSLEDFLSKEGVFDRASTMLFEGYKENKRKEALSLLKSEANAYQDLEQNSKEIQALNKAGKPELASQARLSNPWTNFYYYDVKATNAGQQIATDLAMWGRKEASKLAEIASPAERAAAVAAKAKELQQAYADIPEAFVSAKIDPLIAATTLDLKADIANKAYELNDRTIKRTASELLLGKWRLGAKFNQAESTNTYSTELLKQGVLEQREWLINKQGYSKQEATDALAEMFDKDVIFLDANGDQLNDIGESYSAFNMLRTLGEIQVDGISLLDLRDSKGRNFRNVVEAAVDRATKRQELREGSIERGLQRGQREFTRMLKDRSTLWWTENPNPTDEQIIARQQEEERFIQQQAQRGYLPPGVSYQNAVDSMRDQYKFSQKQLTPEAAALLVEEAKDLIDGGATEIPPDLRARLEGTNVYGQVIGLFGGARRKDNAEARAAASSVQKGLLKGLLDGLKGSFEQDPQIKGLAQQKGEIVKQKRAYLNQAIIEAKQRLRAEGADYLTRKLNQARNNGENINDPTVQLRILQEAQKDFYARREYNDVDSYYNVTDSGKLGAKIQGPVLGSVSKDSSGRWNIQINDKDNRASWSAVASTTYGNNPSLARNLLNTTLVLNEAEIGELNKAITTGDTRSLSQATRRSLANLSNLAFKGKVSVAEIIQKQLGTYYGGQFLPPNLRERSLQLERTVRPAAAVTGDTYRDIGIQITNWNHGHSNNRAVDFTLVRNNGQISNPVPSPVSGRVIYSGRDGGFGNTIVIVADQDGPGYKKGDRVRVAHLAQLYFQAGAQVGRGRPIGKSGDTSPHDSAPGRSGTGAGDPGHVHIQIYKPGGGVPYTNSQYGQAYQNSFVRQNLVPLFKR